MRNLNVLNRLLVFAAPILLGHPDTALAQSLTFSPSAVTLSISGPGSTASTPVSVSSSAGIGGALQVASITTSDRTNWLCAQPSGASLTVSIGTGCSGVSSSQLSNNQTYTGQITVTAPGASGGTLSGTLGVTLQVSPNGAFGLIATPNPVTFSVQTGGSAPSQTVNLSYNGGAITVQSLSTSTGTNQNWLFAQATGSSVLVSINAASLSAGTYSGTVAVGAAGANLNIPVTLTVGGIPTLSVSPTTLSFAYQAGTAAPLPQTISLTSSGTPVNVSVSSSTNSGGTQWLIVTPTGQLTTPAQITVNIQPAGLAAGVTYTGNIQINSSGGATNGTVNIPVTLLVSGSAIIAANPGSLTFTAQAGGAAPAQNLSLSSSGAALGYTVSSSVSTPGGGAWLQVPTQSGTTNGTIAVAVNTAGLAVGTYTGAINVAAPNAGNGNLTVPVTLNITAGPVLQLSVPSLSFAYQIGQTQPQSQTVAIGSAAGQVNYSVATQTTTGQPWLNVSTVNGVAPGNLVVSVATTGLAAGTYNGTITITPSGASNAPQTIQVALVVSNSALLVVSPGTLSFNDALGATASSFQNLAVTSTDGSAIPFSVTENTSAGSNWLLVSSTSGTTPSNLSITANPAGLGIGTYTGAVTIAATSGSVANSPQTVPVTLNVTSSNALSVSAVSLSFAQAGGGPAPAPQTVSVASSGGSSGAQITFAAAVIYNQGQSWLTVSPSNATTPATLTVTANGAGLTPGTYTGQIVLSSPGVGPQTINVTLTVGASGAGLAIAGSMAQLASAGHWTTTFTLINNGASAAQAQLNFFDDNGNALPLPLIFPQTSPASSTPVSTITRTLAPGATLLIQTTGPDTQATQVGWTQLLTNGSISGFAVFGQVEGASQQEAVVPLETRNAASYLVSFDNTSNFATGVALANIANQPAIIPVIVRDDTGAALQSGVITLPAGGHSAFDISVRLPMTIGRRGTLEFQTPSGGQIGVLGLRFNPTGAFSTVPPIEK